MVTVEPLFVVIGYKDKEATLFTTDAEYKVVVGTNAGDRVP
jgi:hypothetical protein